MKNNPVTSSQLDKISGSEIFHRNIFPGILSLLAVLIILISPLKLVSQTYYTVQITATGCLDTLLPGTQVTLTNYSTPPNGDTTSHFGICDSNGVVFFDTIMTGVWELNAYLPEYDQYTDSNVIINGNYTQTIHLIAVAFPPRQFRVDSASSVATWTPPALEALPFQDFEDPQFPPPGWQTYNLWAGSPAWFRSNNGGSQGFPIPPGDGYYAVANSDAMGSGGNANSYLITPSLDLRMHDNYVLEFNSYFDAGYGQTSAIEYSFDSGNTWDLFYSMTPNSQWVNKAISLSSLSGSNAYENLFIAFHTDDHASWASGWAVDNVSITAGSANPNGYFAYLNNDIIDFIDHDTNSYTFQGLDWGQTYTGGIVAAYPCRASEQVQYTWTSSYLYPPRNFSTQYSYGTDEVMCSFQTPAIIATDPNCNLVSYNIYQDDSVINTIHYQGEPVDYTYHVILDNLLPGTHTFKASAMYELSSYGYPGDTAVSIFSDTSLIHITYGFYLPFHEDWHFPDFQTNYWSRTGTGAQWEIDQNVGNPASSAKMVIKPDSNAYSASLTSYYINSDSITNGKIYFDFDIKLESGAPHPSEKLEIEVFNGSEWVLYQTFYSTDTLNFTPQHLNISEDAKNQVFKIRFFASGNNCNTGTAWWVDNIKLYRTCAAPTNLADSLFEYGNNNVGVNIRWNAPDCLLPMDPWEHWDSGENSSDVGITDGGNFTAAIRWDPGSLQRKNGDTITKIRYFIADNNFDYLVLHIWTGENAASLIYSDTVYNSVPSSWSEKNIDTNIIIDATMEYWVGYSIINQSPDGRPAGLDAGPAVSGYGDKIRIANSNFWHNLTDYGINNNWNIEMYVNHATTIDTTLKRFVLYKSLDNFDYSPYDSVEYVSGQTEFNYNDVNVVSDNIYYYKLNAVWIKNDARCISDYALNKEFPMYDYVTAFVTVGINNNKANNPLVLFPNPASNKIAIEAKSNIQKIEVYDLSGKRLFQMSSLSSNKMVLNIESLQSGIYLIKTKTAQGIFINKLVKR